MIEEKEPAEQYYSGNHAIKEFEEAAAYVTGAYKVLRRLAGEAIRSKEVMRMKLAIVRQLAVDLEYADDLDYIRRVAKAIQDTIDN